MRKLLLGALLLFVLLPMSASAAGGNSTNISVEGMVMGPQFSIDVIDPGCGFLMSFGMNELCSPAGVALNPPNPSLMVVAHATQNIPFSVSVSDKLDWGKPAASKGKMAQWNFCWTYTDNPPPPGPLVCPIGGWQISGNCTIQKNQWMPSGKVLTKPMHLNETIGACPACTFKNYNMTLTDPVLFSGMGDTIPGNPPGPGTIRVYSLRQQITLDDTVPALRYDGANPLPGPSPQVATVQQNTYKMPITFILTTL